MTNHASNGKGNPREDKRTCPLQPRARVPLHAAVFRLELLTRKVVLALPVTRNVVVAPLAVITNCAAQRNRDVVASENGSLGLTDSSLGEPLTLAFPLLACMLVVFSCARHVILVLPYAVMVCVLPLAAGSQLAEFVGVNIMTGSVRSNAEGSDQNDNNLYSIGLTQQSVLNEVTA